MRTVGRAAKRCKTALSLQNLTIGAVSSVGRAPARQAGGHWFEPSTAHFLRFARFACPARAPRAVACAVLSARWCARA